MTVAVVGGVWCIITKDYQTLTILAFGLALFSFPINFLEGADSLPEEQLHIGKDYVRCQLKEYDKRGKPAKKV